MDLNDLRSAVTLASFLIFLALLRWAWAAHRRADFDAAARLPFIGDDDGANRAAEETPQ